MSIECELARVQMKRYLGGEELPAELMRSLENHVKACASCREHLDQQRLKLANELAGKKEPPAWKKAFERKPKPGPEGSKVFAPPSPFKGALNTRTLTLSICLALVLFAMSAIAKDPSIIFGPKASDKLTAAKSGDSGHAEPNKEEEGKGETAHSKTGDEAPEEGTGKEEPSTEGGAEDHGKEVKTPATEPEGGASHDPTESKGAGKDTDVVSEKTDHAEPEKPVATEPTKPEKGHEPPAKKPEPEIKTQEPEQRPAAGERLLIAENGKESVKRAPKPGPRVEPSRRIRKTVKRRPARAARTRASSPKKTAAPRSRGIRVYDANGKPLK